MKKSRKLEEKKSSVKRNSERKKESQIDLFEEAKHADEEAIFSDLEDD